MKKNWNILWFFHRYYREYSPYNRTKVGYRLERRTRCFQTDRRNGKGIRRIGIGYIDLGLRRVARRLVRRCEGVEKKAGLSSKEVALFGCGDSESYCDTFCDGIGVLYEELKGTGCKFIGNHVPTGDYNFSSSTAVVDGEFAGLPLDEMNESDKTEGRIDNWVKSLKD